MKWLSELLTGCRASPVSVFSHTTAGPNEQLSSRATVAPVGGANTLPIAQPSGMPTGISRTTCWSAESCSSAGGFSRKTYKLKAVAVFAGPEQLVSIAASAHTSLKRRTESL